MCRVLSLEPSPLLLLRTVGSLHSVFLYLLYGGFTFDIVTNCPGSVCWRCELRREFFSQNMRTMHCIFDTVLGQILSDFVRVKSNVFPRLSTLTYPPDIFDPTTPLKMPNPLRPCGCTKTQVTTLASNCNNGHISPLSFTSWGEID